MLTFTPAKCPTCGEPPEATLETLIGFARLVVHEDGQAEYEGTTDIVWDSQMTVTDEDGRVTLACFERHEWQAVMHDSSIRSK